LAYRRTARRWARRYAAKLFPGAPLGGFTEHPTVPGAYVLAVLDRGGRHVANIYARPSAGLIGVDHIAATSTEGSN